MQRVNFSYFRGALLIIALLVTIQVGRGADVLVVADLDDANDAAGNQSIVDRLEFLGHTVTMINDNGSQLSDAEGKDLVVVSSSSNSGDVGTKYTDQDPTFRGWQIPTINWENALNDEYLIADSGSGPDSDSIIITDLGAMHPLGAGLSAGAQVVRDSSTAFHGIDNANLAPGAQIIGEHSSGSFSIVVVEPGGLLNDGATTASARRIGTFFGDASLDGTNASGLALFDAAVAYSQTPNIRILFHGSGVEPTGGADGAVMAHLQGRYGPDNVVYMQGDMAAADGSDANGFDVVIISSTLGSGTVRNKYEDTPVGLMNWEQALMRQAAGEFNMSVGGRTQPDETQIEIVDPTHPIAAGLSGTVDVYSAPNTNSYGRDGVAPGATLIARGVTDSTDLAIFAAEAGDALLGDGTPGNPATADGRRVMFFLEDNGFSAITPDGIKMFDAAVDWLAVPEPSSILLGLMGLVGMLALRRRRAV